jgi:non-specific serine/threonine protein kinase
VRTGRPPLSERETTVASLIARGASNREIGRELGISPRTVETHVEHLLRKLGCRARSQVAAWAVARGLYLPPLDQDGEWVAG